MTTPIKLPREDKEQLVADVQQYAETELGEHMGNIAAEGLLNHILSLVTPYVYNQAIRSAKEVVTAEFARLDEELSVLERPLTHRR